MIKVPFSPPFLSDNVTEIVQEVLQSGWITTGPKVAAFEKALENYTQVEKVFCVNSATAGLQMVLQWWGIGEGDEVIVPAYTYCSTANVILHCGATPIMVDIKESDLTIDTALIAQKITARTKAIIVVDLGGVPCDYAAIQAILQEKQSLFSPNNAQQRQLNRCLLMADAAHSLGALYQNRPAVLQTDASVFSFHAVKNLTTAEGGAIAWNMPAGFDQAEIYKWCKMFSLNGQTKTAFAKQGGVGWEYDVVAVGYKYNMPDILAALGLAGMTDYADVLVERKKIMDFYNTHFGNHPELFHIPVFETKDKTSSYHLYPLRLKNGKKAQRDALIQHLADKGIASNVHYKPLPLLSVYKNLGYEIAEYPVSQQLWEEEISLPVFVGMREEQLQHVVSQVIDYLAI
jgi:dTDP-4-amino-4,6-dideoxygalactose transaminase